MNTCCKWCGVAENQWSECADKLDVLGEFGRLYDLCLRLEKRRAEEKEEAALTPKTVQKGAVAAAPKAMEMAAKEPVVAKCLHNEVTCKHPLKRRCFACRKKVALNGFDCDCGKIFCSKHQAPLGPSDDLEHGHLCDFDFANKAQEKLLSMYAETEVSDD